MSERRPRPKSKESAFAALSNNENIDLLLVSFQNIFKLTQHEMEVLVQITPPGELLALLQTPQLDNGNYPPIEMALARLRVEKDANKNSPGEESIKHLVTKLETFLFPSKNTTE